MSISVVTSASPAASLNPTEFAQRKKNLDALESALESGDLGAAQSAFSTIQQDLQNMPKPPGGARAGAFTQAQDDFGKIGDALKSGDVNAAKEAFDAWKQDLQQLRAHRQRSGGDANASSDLTSTSSTNSTFNFKA